MTGTGKTSETVKGLDSAPMIKIDYDEIASRIANCSKVSDCQDIFKNWESLSNPLKLDLSILG